MSDAFTLAGIIRKEKPRRIVEIGSGFSSAVMLDTLSHAGLSADLTFIEPYPERLHSLLSPADRSSAKILVSPVQEVPMAVFDQLEAQDVLFIDSSHVAKVGSDVTYLLLRVLPRLKKGVIVHFHDIFYPNSYPTDWLREGRAWNESLFLRAFLLGNPKFQILAFNSFAGHSFPEFFDARLPEFMKNTGGSIWLRKILGVVLPHCFKHRFRHVVLSFGEAVLRPVQPPCQPMVLFKGTRDDAYGEIALFGGQVMRKFYTSICATRQLLTSQSKSISVVKYFAECDGQIAAMGMTIEQYHAAIRTRNSKAASRRISLSPDAPSYWRTWGLETAFSFGDYLTAKEMADQFSYAGKRIRECKRSGDWRKCQYYAGMGKGLVIALRMLGTVKQSNLPQHFGQDSSGIASIE